MCDSMTIRRATRGDLDLLVEFNLRMAMETEDLQLEREVLERGIEGIFKFTDRGFYLVAEIDGMVVGSLMVTTEWSDWRNGDFWWVQSVYVRPEFRRRGVFTRLFHHVRESAHQADRVCGYRLYVEKENLAAQAAYQKLGFEETHYRLYESCFR